MTSSRLQGNPGRPEQVHPVRHELVYDLPKLVPGLGFLAELPGAERIGLHHLAREVGQAVLEEAIGVDDDHPRPEVELLDDCQREPVGFTEAEAQDVIAQPPRLEEGVEHARPRAEHQPRVAEQNHVGALEMVQGDRIGAEIQHVMVDVAAVIVRQVVIVRGPFRQCDVLHPAAQVRADHPHAGRHRGHQAEDTQEQEQGGRGSRPRVGRSRRQDVSSLMEVPPAGPDDCLPC